GSWRVSRSYLPSLSLFPEYLDPSATGIWFFMGNTKEGGGSYDGVDECLFLTSPFLKHTNTLKSTSPRPPSTFLELHRPLLQPPRHRRLPTGGRGRVSTTHTTKPTSLSSILTFHLSSNTTTSSSFSAAASSAASAVTCGKVFESKCKKDVPENRTLYPFPALIGRGYDISTDLRLKYCKGGDSSDSRLIEIDEDDGREIVLPSGITISNVSKSIQCDKGERTRFRSDVLSFQQVFLLQVLLSFILNDDFLISHHNS
ncbi:uncharacterized protein LOC21411513, partial [Morus notabilis]|uniref:uncharacterized protein LOC21411513 n=1 Tax=Morus notabilis TaxID=981085 RepID=UPI000CECE506